MIRPTFSPNQNKCENKTITALTHTPTHTHTHSHTMHYIYILSVFSKHCVAGCVPLHSSVAKCRAEPSRAQHASLRPWPHMPAALPTSSPGRNNLADTQHLCTCYNLSALNDLLPMPTTTARNLSVMCQRMQGHLQGVRDPG